jgi:7-keto-8-aminopelargonate synthetase-like enzyme
MIDIDARVDELERLGLGARTRLVSGPQGSHALVGGRPVLLLGSSNYLGLADHPRVREAAADAAMRWGVGAGSPRTVSGTMTVHRRMEERLAEFHGHPACVLLGSGYLAMAAVVGALAEPEDVVLCDALASPAALDGCRLAGAEPYRYDHLDLEHLAWGLRRLEGRGALIVTEGVCPLDGEVAPLPEILELADRFGARVVVDEGHATGTLGRGRGAAAEAGVADEVDVIVGTLGGALGAHGGYACGDESLVRYLLGTSWPLSCSTAPSPPAVAGALAALSLLVENPRRIEKLGRNGNALRTGIARRGLQATGDSTPIAALELGDAGLVTEIAEKALRDGLLVHAVRPPVVDPPDSRIRLCAVASHSESELIHAGERIADLVLEAGWQDAPTETHRIVAAPDPVGDRAPVRSELFDQERAAEISRAA